MQSLDIISVNLWQILISLCNLTLLFLILKKFLYKPVTRMLKKREEELQGKYDDAETARNEALKAERELTAELASAKNRAEEIISDAAHTAELRGDKIIEEARDEAVSIINRAKGDAELEMRRAEQAIKGEIVDVSAAIAEKLLEREINSRDHSALIDSFIEKIGEEE